jgi:hypothetical protein
MFCFAATCFAAAPAAPPQGLIERVDLALDGAERALQKRLSPPRS